MDIVKTNTKTFVKTPQGKCISQIMAVAEPGGFRIYVAWEWEGMAASGCFGFCKSQKLHKEVTAELINHTADYGWDIGQTGEEKAVFANLFTTAKP